MDTLHLTAKNVVLTVILFSVMLTPACGFRMMKETEWAEYQKLKQYENPAKINVRILAFLEKEALDIVSSKRDAGTKETAEAEQFLKDLRTVDESLPADRKILRENGKLIIVTRATPLQESTLLELVLGSSGAASADEEVNAAMRRIRDRATPLRETFDLSRTIQN